MLYSLLQYSIFLTINMRKLFKNRVAQVFCLPERQRSVEEFFQEVWIWSTARNLLSFHLSCSPQPDHHPCSDLNFASFCQTGSFPITSVKHANPSWLVASRGGIWARASTEAPNIVIDWSCPTMGRRMDDRNTTMVQNCHA